MMAIGSHIAPDKDPVRGDGVLRQRFNEMEQRASHW